MAMLVVISDSCSAKKEPKGFSVVLVLISCCLLAATSDPPVKHSTPAEVQQELAIEEEFFAGQPKSDE